MKIVLQAFLTFLLVILANCVIYAKYNTLFLICFGCFIPTASMLLQCIIEDAIKGARDD